MATVRWQSRALHFRGHQRPITFAITVCSPYLCIARFAGIQAMIGKYGDGIAGIIAGDPENAHRSAR